MTKQTTMSVDDLQFALYTSPKRELSDGQLVAAGLFRIADSIDDIGNKLMRHAGDGEEIATALEGIASALHNRNDLESAKHPEAAAVVAEKEAKLFEH